MSGIEYSVGLGGVNKHQDVSEIQRLLKIKGFPYLKVDGLCGRNTIRAIMVYQKHFYRHPDGLISLGGKTIEILTKSINHTNSLPKPHGATGRNPRGERMSSMGMSPSYQCLMLMMQYETLRTRVYDDQTGKDINQMARGATIGYGHLITTQAEFDKYSNGISQQECERLFSSDLSWIVALVRTYIKVLLTQNEFDAIIMMSFSIGPGNPRSKHHAGLFYSKVLKIINGESPGDLDNAWMMYIYTQGHTSNGLINRRRSELNVYHNGVYIKL